MANIVSFAARLAAARYLDRRGRALIDVLAVVAFAVTSWLVFVVASGTWMFVQRTQVPPTGLIDVINEVQAPATMVSDTAGDYVALAAMACAILVVPIFSLGGAAARLGAGGRSRRLASLRLVGMTSGEVVAMSVWESLVQALVGVVLGAIAWAATLPVLTRLSFQRSPLTAAELLMPAWLWGALILILLLLAGLSTVVGLSRVRITPLGVARQVRSPALARWRVVGIVVAIAAFAIVTSTLDVSGGATFAVFVLAVMTALTVGALNLFAPWLLQVLARGLSVAGRLPWLLATRRIQADPKGAWRNVASLALIGVVVGVLAPLPMRSAAFEGLPANSGMLYDDIRLGAMITLVIGVIVGAVATLIAQSADVLDRAEEARALDRMGVPARLDARVRRYQVLWPLLLTLVISLGLGSLAAMPFVTQLRGLSYANGYGLIAGAVVMALLLSLGAAEATRSLRRMVVGTQIRRND